MHIKLTNDVPEKYSIGQLRRDNPQVSFPSEIPDDTLAEYSVYPLAATPMPTYDPETQRVSEGLAELVDGVWMQTWVVADLTAEELAERLSEWRQGMAVSPLQMRRALRAKNLYDAITAYVEQQDADTQDAWEYAVEIRRDDALIAAAADALAKSDAEVDDLFRLAASF
jgi:hypothetical protein